MADEGLIYLLQRGVTIWNQWRKEHPDIWPDLTDANLHRINLNGADLNRADLALADLSEAIVNTCNLYRANLSRVVRREVALVIVPSAMRPKPLSTRSLTLFRKLASWPTITRLNMATLPERR